MLTRRAAHIQLEAARLYGRKISRERARELLAEVIRYERAISELDQERSLEEEPSSFLELLIRLAGDAAIR